MHKINSNSFLKLPTDYTNLGLSASELIILSQIISLANINSLDNPNRKVCIAFNRTLGEFINRSKYTASRVIRRLKEKGLVAYNLIYRPGSFEVQRRELFPLNIATKVHQIDQQKKSKAEKQLSKKITAIFDAYPKRTDEPQELTEETYRVIKDALSVYRQYHLNINTNLQAANELLSIVKNFASISNRWNDEQKIYRFGIKSFMTRNEFTNDPVNWLRKVDLKAPRSLLNKNNTNIVNRSKNGSQCVVLEDKEDNVSLMQQQWAKATDEERKITGTFVKYSFGEATSKWVKEDSYYLYLAEALKWHREKEPL